MSHDTDKLIRQLSLVAFLMAERRPLTARDIKSNVEGYQEMSDEAFALIDLRGLRFVDLSGIGVLERAWSRPVAGTRPPVVIPSRCVRRLMGVLELPEPLLAGSAADR